MVAQSSRRSPSGSANASGKRGQSRKPKRTVSPRMRRIYRRRRIVAAILALIVLSLAGFSMYSLSRGIGAVAQVIAQRSGTDISKRQVPTPKQTTGVYNCTSKDVTLNLEAASSTIAVGGSAEFKLSIAYGGKSSCLFDPSGDQMVLTIVSGDETIYRSSDCPENKQQLLFAKGDSTVQSLVWPTTRSSTDCGAEPLRVGAGTYVAQVHLTSDEKAKSQEVPIIIQ